MDYDLIETPQRETRGAPVACDLLRLKKDTDPVEKAANDAALRAIQKFRDELRRQ